MRRVVYILAVAAMFIAGCGGTEDVRQFNTDLGVYLTKAWSKSEVIVNADCTPVEDAMNCTLRILRENGEDKIDAKNVRRDGDKFIWDKS